MRKKGEHKLGCVVLIDKNYQNQTCNKCMKYRAEN